jgi:hypothetical protein
MFWQLYSEYMPRKAIPYSPEAQRARVELTKYLAMPGRKALALSKAAGIAQPTLSKFLTGRTKTVTPDIRRALEYAGIAIDMGIAEADNLADNAILYGALMRAWDGTFDHAKLLAEVIETVGPVLSRHLSNL